MCHVDLTPIVVEGILKGDEVVTNVAEMRRQVETHKGQVAAVFSTTSCFSPRAYDESVLFPSCEASNFDIFILV